MDNLKKIVYLVLGSITLIFILLYFFSIEGSLICSDELNEISLSLSTCFLSGLIVAFSFDYANELKRKRKRKDILVFLLSACVDTFKNSVFSIAMTKFHKTSDIVEECKQINCYSYFTNLFSFNKEKNSYEQGNADNEDTAYLLMNFKVDSYFSETFRYFKGNKSSIILQEVFSSIEIEKLEELDELFKKFRSKTNTRDQKIEYVLRIYSILLIHFKAFKKYLDRPAYKILIDSKNEKDASELRLETFKKFPARFY